MVIQLYLKKVKMHFRFVNLANEELDIQFDFWIVLQAPADMHDVVNHNTVTSTYL